MSEPTPHMIAHSLARQVAADAGLREAVERLGLVPLRVFLDDDSAERDDGAPHAVFSPANSSGGMGKDDEINVAAIVTLRDSEETGATLSIDPDGPPETNAEAMRFDALAEAVWQAVKRAQPGAVLEGRSADWDFAGRYPLRFVGFTLNYRSIHSFEED